MPDKKTLGNLLKESFGIFTGNLAGLSGVALAAYLPLEIFVIAFVLTVTGRAPETQGPGGERFVLSMIFLVVTIGVSLIYQVAVVKTVQSIYNKAPLKPLAAYKAAWEDMGGYLTVVAWVTVKVFLWSLVLIVPGIVFGIFYSFSTFSFLLDGKQGTEALRFSKSLIRPNAWRFIGNSLAVGLAAGMVSLVVIVVLSLIFGAPSGGSPTFASLVIRGVGNIINAVIGTYVFVFYYLLYEEFKKTSAAI